MATTVPYQSFHDEDIGVHEDDISESGSEVTQEGDRDLSTEAHNIPAGPSTAAQRRRRDVNTRVQQYLDEDRWPKKIGILHLVHGILLLILGLCEVIVLPLVLSAENNPIHLNQQNCYGVGIWTGFLLGLSGTVALRATMHQSSKALSVFVLLVLLEIVAMSAFLLMIVVGYSSKWTTPDAYHDSGAQFGVHVAVSCMISIGYILVLHAFTLYYEEVLCGEVQLCRKMVHCCMPCWCPRAVHQSELQDEEAAQRPPDERPPSLPV